MFLAFWEYTIKTQLDTCDRAFAQVAIALVRALGARVNQPCRDTAHGEIQTFCQESVHRMPAIPWMGDISHMQLAILSLDSSENPVA
jgi:hypothetical protein